MIMTNTNGKTERNTNGTKEKNTNANECKCTRRQNKPIKKLIQMEIKIKILPGLHSPHLEMSVGRLGRQCTNINGNFSLSISYTVAY